MFIYTIQDIFCGGILILALGLMAFAWVDYKLKEWRKK